MGPDPVPLAPPAQGESGPSGPAGPTGARGAPVSTEDLVDAPSLALSSLILPSPLSIPPPPLLPSLVAGERSSGPLRLPVPLLCPTCPPRPRVRASLQLASFSSRETVVSLVPPALLASLGPL